MRVLYITGQNSLNKIRLIALNDANIFSNSISIIRISRCMQYKLGIPCQRKATVFDTHAYAS